MLVSTTNVTQYRADSSQCTHHIHRQDSHLKRNLTTSRTVHAYSNHKLVNARINASKQVEPWKYSRRYFLKHTQVCSLRNFNQTHRNCARNPQKGPRCEPQTAKVVHTRGYLPAIRNILILYLLKQTQVRTLRNSTQQASKTRSESPKGTTPYLESYTLD